MRIMTEAGDLTRRIVETAVTLAERRSWESIRLHEVAEALDIGLDDIRQHFREKDELIDAWFERADEAVLKLADSGDLASLGPRERLFELIMVWLDAMENHRRVTRQMIQSKLEPGHIHIQIPAVMRISRTVQWIREGASLSDSGVQRALTETAVTGIYLAAFTAWMTEGTTGSPRTRRLLDALLRQAERALQFLPFIAGDAKADRNDSANAGKPPAWTP